MKSVRLRSPEGLESQPDVSHRSRASHPSSLALQTSATIPVALQRLQRLQRDAGNGAVRSLGLAAAGHRPVAQLVLQRKPKKVALPKVTVHVNPVGQTTYRVAANSLADAARQLSVRGEAGETTWAPKVAYDLDGAGIVTHVRIRANASIEMPSWAGASRLPSAQLAEWRRALRALDAHERGHVDIVQDKLKAIGHAMVGQSRANADATFAEGIATLQAASDAYDASNNHGLENGTEIKLPPD